MWKIFYGRTILPNLDYLGWFHNNKYSLPKENLKSFMQALDQWAYLGDQSNFVSFQKISSMKIKSTWLGELPTFLWSY